MRENVNRQLKLWEAQGLVRQEDGVIVIISPDTLAHMGED